MSSLSDRSSPEQQALHVALEGLYRVFAPYPLREVLTGCPHCLQQTDVDRLHAIPLRLTREDLSQFLGNSAAQTVGDTLDFKHFFPRLWELVAWEEARYALVFLPELLGTGVSRHGYVSWPQAEQQALETFCLAWWQAILATGPRQPVIQDDRIDSVLCAISQFTDDVTPYLATWRRTRSGTALLQLVVFIRYYLMDEHGKGRRSPWWQIREPQWQQVEAWVHDPATAAWIEEGWNRLVKRVEPPPSIVQWHDQVLGWLARQAPDE